MTAPFRDRLFLAYLSCAIFENSESDAFENNRRALDMARNAAANAKDEDE